MDVCIYAELSMLDAHVSITWAQYEVPFACYAVGNGETFLETQIDQGRRACFVGARCRPIEDSQPCLKLPIRLTSHWKFSESASGVLCGYEHFDMALKKKVA